MVADVAGSHVHGVLTSNGLFEGKITTPYDQYVIEEAQRYFPKPLPFHSVIYKYSDINVGLLNNSLCHGDSLHDKLRTLQREEVKQSKKYELTNQNAFIFKSNVNVANRTAGYKYANGDIRSWNAAHHHRQRRAVDPSKTTCTLYLQADHLFYEKFSNNEELVIEQLTQHVQGVNSIYQIIGIHFDIKHVMKYIHIYILN